MVPLKGPGPMGPGPMGPKNVIIFYKNTLSTFFGKQKKQSVITPPGQAHRRTMTANGFSGHKRVAQIDDVYDLLQ